MCGAACSRPPRAVLKRPLFHIEDHPWLNRAERSNPSLRGRARLLVVEARYYDDIGEMLLSGARRAAAQAGAEIELLAMPGALEIPAAIAIACDKAQAAGQP